MYNKDKISRNLYFILGFAKMTATILALPSILILYLVYAIVVCKLYHNVMHKMFNASMYRLQHLVACFDMLCMFR